MATIERKTDKNGKTRAYKLVAYLGRDEKNKKIRCSTTIEPPEGLTPKREEKEVQRLADEWEREKRAEYEESLKRNKTQLRTERDKISLPDFIDKHWMEKHVKDGKHTPDTIAFYNNMAKDIKAYFSAEKPNLKLADIRKEDILDYLAYLRNTARTKKGTPYGATTIQHHFSTLRNVLEFAVYIDYLKEDPCKKLKQTDRPQREDHEVEFLEEEDALRFMSCLESDEEKEYWITNHGSHLFWKTLVNMLIVTGLRRGELVGLQWGDLDKKNMMLHIRRNVTLDTSHKGETDPEKKIHIGETKSKKIRKVPVSKYLLDLLVSLKEEEEAQFKGSLLPKAFIFCRSDNAYLPIYPTEPTRLMKKFIKRHELPDVSPHDLRHTAASLAIESGANVKEIQALLGHKDAATTLKFYTGISEKTQRGTIDGIEGILRPKKENKEAK